MIQKLYHHIYENKLELHYLKRFESTHITIEIWVKVGSANEFPHEHGICHMIEHMMFKGSQKILLGMLDDIIYQMGGKANAYTSQDFTVYTFSVPNNFYESLIEVLSLLFESPRFASEDLELEKKIVIQEILSYEDDSFSVLLDESFLNSRSKYNYKHPVLGTRDTVINFRSKQLIDFYNAHYIPSNMKIFVTGDITFNGIKKALGNTYFITNQDTRQGNIRVNYYPPTTKKKIKKINYRYSSTLNKHFLLVYKFPICRYNNKHIFKGLNILLGDGKDSLLYKKLCIELKLVTDIKSFFHGFIKETFYFVYFIPIDINDVTKIMTAIQEVINDIKNGEIDQNTITKIHNILFFEYNMLISENADDFTFEMGPYFFEGQKKFLTFKKMDQQKFLEKIIALSKHFNHQKLIVNALLPHELHAMPPKEKISFEKFVQEKEAFIDAEQNNNKKKLEIEEATENNEHKAFNIFNFQKKRIENQKNIKTQFSFLKKKKFPTYHDIPKHTKTTLQNGIIAVLHNDYFNKKNNNDIIILSLSLAVKYYYDDINYQGSVAFLFDLMGQGTISYKGTQFIDLIEQYGIQFNYSAGEIQIRFLKEYLNIVIVILTEYLFHPEFNKEHFDLLKKQTIDGIKNFMDDPQAQSIQYARETVYKNHPYAKNPSGTIETISVITLEYIEELYKKYVTPYNAILVVVGNIEEKEFHVITTALSAWQGEKLTPPLFPKIQESASCKSIILKESNKDQNVIVYTAKSATKYTPDFYYLLLGEQLLTGSIVDSMYSLLFQIREHTGFFYHIGGSLLYGSDNQSGMILISAMNEIEHTNEALSYIKETVHNLHRFINEYDLYIAKQALLTVMADKKSSKSIVSQVLMNMYKYNLSEKDYMHNYTCIKNATLENIKFTLKKYLNEENFYTIITKKY